MKESLMLKYKLNEISAVEIYKLVLTGKLKKFPNGFLQLPEAKQNSIDCFKFLLEQVLNWKEEDIKRYFTIDIVTKYKLRASAKLFNSSLFKIVDEIYPDKFKPWELPNAPNRYWNRETALKATKWMIEEKLQWTDDELKQNLNYDIFKEYKLNYVLDRFFSSSPYIVVNILYPNKFKPWEFNKCQAPSGYWNKEDGINAVKWLIEEKLKWSYEDTIENITANTFKENGLYSMLHAYSNSPYLILKNCYPEKNWNKLKTKINKTQ